jgi:hypothetical protein
LDRVRTRLAPGAKWIRTFSSALEAAVSWVRPSWGRSTGAPVIEQLLPASAYRSNCRAMVRRIAAHRPDPAPGKTARAQDAVARAHLR